MQLANEMPLNFCSREPFYYLDKNQYRILYLIMTKLAIRQSANRNDGLTCKIYVSEYAEIFKLNSAESSKHIRRAVERFKGHIMRLREKEREFLDIKTFPTPPCRIERGCYQFTLNSRLQHLIVDMAERYSNVRPEHLKLLLNPHSLRLNETLMNAVSGESELDITLSVDWMREAYCLPKSYDFYPEFKRSFIVNVLDEINVVSGKNIRFTPKRRGNKIIALRFFTEGKS